MIYEIVHLLPSSFPYKEKMVEQGAFKGLRCITYGKGRHRMLNYVVFMRFMKVKDILMLSTFCHLALSENE